MSAKPYTDAEIAVRREKPVLWQSVAEGNPTLPYPIRDDSRWLATVDALQSRLAAAEAERNEWKDIASVFLAATEPNQPIPVQGQIMLAQVRERERATFDARAALAAPEPASAEAVAREALQHFVSPYLLTDAARTVAHALRAQGNWGAK